jgi:hypothetical protein
LHWVSRSGIPVAVSVRTGFKKVRSELPDGTPTIH